MSQDSPKPLPARLNLEWLRKSAKHRLAEMRAADSGARLSDAQRCVAREYGFASWRKLKAHVDERARASAEFPVPLTVAPDDPELAGLFSAVHAGDLQTAAQLLAQRPALAGARGLDGQTALHAAAWCNDPRLGALLIHYGADPNALYGQSGHTAFSWAVTCGSLHFAQALVRLGHAPDLFCAAGTGSDDAVRAWFDDAGHLRPGAARTGSSRLAADGTRLPCPPPTAVEQVSDALYIACRNRQTEVVRFLLDRRPDLSFRAYMGGTALHWAYFGGSREVIRLLEEAGADAAARDDVLGCTPRGFGICAPANWGFLELVHERLAEDPSLAGLTDGGTSPLHEAARGGHAEVAEALLDAGADPRVRNADGKLPADLALEGGHGGVVALLRRQDSTG